MEGSILRLRTAPRRRSEHPATDDYRHWRSGSLSEKESRLCDFVLFASAGREPADDLTGPPGMLAGTQGCPSGHSMAVQHPKAMNDAMSDE